MVVGKGGVGAPRAILFDRIVAASQRRVRR